MYSMQSLRRSPNRVVLEWAPLEERAAPGDLLMSSWSPFDGIHNPTPTLRDDVPVKTESPTKQLTWMPASDAIAVIPQQQTAARAFTELEFSVDSRRDPGLENIRIQADRLLPNDFRPLKDRVIGGSSGDAGTPTSFAVRTGTASLEASPPAGSISISAPKAAAAPQSDPIGITTPDAVSRTSTKTESTSEYSYTAEGKSIALAVQPNRIAVLPVNTSDAGRAALLGNDGPFAGYTLVRGLGNRGMMIEGPDAAAWLNAPVPAGVTAIAPVFKPNVANGTDMAVLDEVNVALLPGVDPQAFFDDHGIASFQHIPTTTGQYVATIDGTGTAALEAARTLAADPRANFAEPNFYVNWELEFTPNDPRFPNQWHLNNTGASGGVANADVRAKTAWDVNPGGATTSIIAVIDSGVQIDHPDIKIWVNPGEIAGNSIDDDNNGFTDDINGWNFVAGNNQPGTTFVDDNHGMAVAGVAAARGNNSVGVTGLAYNASVMSVKIFEGPNVASIANIAAAVGYGAGRKASGGGTFANVSVQNNSWGGYGTVSGVLGTAFSGATTVGRGGLGTVVTTSAGNAGQDAATHYPSNYMVTNAGVISTGASTNSDTLASYSNYGATVDFVTPSDGGSLSIDTTDRTGSSGYDPTDYTGTAGNGFGGTSSASPLAGGIASLVLSQADAKGVSLTAGHVRSLLRNSTTLAGGVAYNITTGLHNRFSYGRLNAFTAVDGVGKPEVSVTGTTAEVLTGATSAFGTVTVSASSTQTFRIRNQGTSDLNLSNLAITAGSTNYFVQSSFGAGTLKIGESTNFTVRFTPSIAGALPGTVSFTTNDTSEGTFSINFTGTGKLPNIGGTTFQDWNGNGIKDANDPGLAGVSVYLDNNNNAMNDIIPSTLSKTSSPNLVIPDGDPNGVFNSITLTGLSGFVTGVTVKVNISHTYVSDLAFALVSPAGTQVLLANGVGGSGVNFTNTLFDDAGTVSINTGTAPFTGTYKPDEILGLFNGEQVNGAWSLVLADFVDADEGTLLNWSLNLNYNATEPTAITDANGGYFFDGLGPLTTTVRADLPANFTATSGGAGIPVTLAGSGSSKLGVDFGSGKNDRIYGRVYNDANLNGIFDTAELPLAGQKMYLDTDGNGILNPPPPPFTYVNGTKYAIPDGNSVGVTSTIDVDGQIGDVIGTRVTLNATHTRDSDLSFRLISPGGTVIPLATNRGEDGANYTVTTFDDAAATAIAAGTAPFSGSYKPESPLGILNGTSANGTWSLVSVDSTGTQTGHLLAWSLELLIGTNEPTAVTAANGNFFFDLPAGSNNVAYSPNALFKSFAPISGVIVSNAAGAPLFNRLWGAAEAVRPTVTTPTLVNGGTAQHSKVTSTTLVFSEKVTISGPPADAFTITGPGGTVPFTANVDNSGATTKVTLTFAGSIADGRYIVTAATGLITDAAQNTMAVPAPIQFHQLYGDQDGNATIDGADLALFGNTFGLSLGTAGYAPELDSNLDNTVDGTDFITFGNRFGKSV